MAKSEDCDDLGSPFTLRPLSELRPQNVKFVRKSQLSKSAEKPTKTEQPGVADRIKKRPFRMVIGLVILCSIALVTQLFYSNGDAQSIATTLKHGRKIFSDHVTNNNHNNDPAAFIISSSLMNRTNNHSDLSIHHNSTIVHDHRRIRRVFFPSAEIDSDNNDDHSSSMIPQCGVHYRYIQILSTQLKKYFTNPKNAHRKNRVRTEMVDWMMNNRTRKDKDLLRLKLVNGSLYSSKPSGYSHMIRDYVKLFVKESLENGIELPNFDMVVYTVDYIRIYHWEWSNQDIPIFNVEGEQPNNHGDQTPLVLHFVSRSLASMIIGHDYSKQKDYLSAKNTTEWIDTYSHFENKRPQIVFMATGRNRMRQNVAYLANRWEQLARAAVGLHDGPLPEITKQEHSKYGWLDRMLDGRFQKEWSDYHVTRKYDNNNNQSQKTTKWISPVDPLTNESVFHIKMTPSPYKSKWDNWIGHCRTFKLDAYHCWSSKLMSIEEEMRYRMFLSIDGIGVRDALPRQLQYGSVPVIWNGGKRREWWYYDLEDNVHYLGFKNESHFLDLMEELIRNDGFKQDSIHNNNNNNNNGRMLQIANNAQRFFNEYLSKEKVHCFMKQMIHLWNEYFYQSNTANIPVSSQDHLVYQTPKT